MVQRVETVVTKVASSDMSPEGTGESCLVLIYGDTLGRRYFLNDEEQIIGRSDLAHIQVDQESVSRQHAAVRSDGGSNYVRDLNSTNGTFLNNVKITSESLLKDGDLLRVGQSIFKYLSGSNIESKYHEEIYRTSTVDGLTGLYNKRVFLETLERELERSQRYQRPLTLALIDIDKFKNINDTFGHLAGDSVLASLAQLLLPAVRRQDFFARFGGEEFALIFPEIDVQSAATVCEKLRSKTQEHQFSHLQKPIPVTISLGVVGTEGLTHTVACEDFIEAADKQLYIAKNNGRNCVSMAYFPEEEST